MTRRLGAIAALAVSFSLAAAARESVPAAHATVADVAWLEGAWSTHAADQSVEERWTSPAGGNMLAVGRTVRSGRLIEFEFLRIVERDGGLVYVAQPNGQPPTEFRMTRIDHDSVTFENPGHDFPKMIRYERRGGRTLIASVAGADGEGAVTFEYTRQ